MPPFHIHSKLQLLRIPWVGIKRGTWNGMERGMEYGMERQTVKKTVKLRLEKKKDTCFDLFSLRTAARKEWRAVVECETR